MSMWSIWPISSEICVGVQEVFLVGMMEILGLTVSRWNTSTLLSTWVWCQRQESWVYVKVLVVQSCPTLCDSMDCSPPGLLCPWDSPGKNIGVGSHSLLQGIFPTYRLNPGLLHCKQILYLLSHQGNSRKKRWKQHGSLMILKLLNNQIWRVAYLWNL